MKPVPRSVAADAIYTEHPLRRLTATCLPHWDTVEVGEPFRWSDENIRLADGVDTSFQEWDRLLFQNRIGFGFKHTFDLFCKTCGRVTKHAPKGYQ